MCPSGISIIQSKYFIHLLMSLPIYFFPIQVVPEICFIESTSVYIARHLRFSEHMIRFCHHCIEWASDQKDH